MSIKIIYLSIYKISMAFLICCLCVEYMDNPLRCVLLSAEQAHTHSRRRQLNQIYACGWLVWNGLTRPWWTWIPHDDDITWRLSTQKGPEGCQPKRTWRLSTQKGTEGCQPKKDLKAVSPKRTWKLLTQKGTEGCQPKRTWRLST